MHDIGGFDERALLGKIARALDASTGMGKDETRPVEPGVTVRTVAFERLVQELAGEHQLFVMDPKGTLIHEQVFGDKWPSNRPMRADACMRCSSKSRNCSRSRMRLALKASSFSERSEEHTSELQSLMRISYAVFCLKKKTKHK